MSIKDSMKNANAPEMKIIAELREKGETMNFSKERIEALLKNIMKLDFKLKIVPVNTITHGDCESS